MKEKICKIVSDNQGTDGSRVFINLLSDEALELLNTNDKKMVSDAVRQMIAEGLLEGSVSTDNVLTEVWPAKR